MTLFAYKSPLAYRDLCNFDFGKIRCIQKGKIRKEQIISGKILSWLQGETHYNHLKNTAQLSIFHNKIKYAYVLGSGIVIGIVFLYCKCKEDSFFILK